MDGGMGGDGALGGSNMAPFLTKLFQIVSNDVYTKF